jgi:hypothetical protein
VASSSPLARKGPPHGYQNRQRGTRDPRRYRRRDSAVLDSQQTRRVPRPPLGRARQALGIRRPGHPRHRRLPHLPGRRHRPAQLRERLIHRVRRPGQLQGPTHRRRLPRRPAQQPAVDPHRPRRHRRPGTRCRRARRPAAAQGRESRQDRHLPTHGDQHGRRGDDLALRLRVPARGRVSDRAAQRHRRVVRLRSVLLVLDRHDAPQQPAPHGHPHLDTGRLRHGAAVRRDQGHTRGHHRGSPDRRRQRTADLLQGHHPADQSHDHHRLHHRADRCHEGLRHRLHHDQRRLQHRRHRPAVLQRTVHQRQRGLRRDHRRPADAGHHPGPHLYQVRQFKAEEAGR